MPKGVIDKTVEKGIEPKSEVSIIFSGPFQYDQTERVALRAMTQVLQERLRESIREELGGTYSITVRPDMQKLPNPEFSITVQFSGDPKRMSDLIQRVYQEIDRFKAGGAAPEQARDVREGLLREFETSSTQNGYLLGQIVGRYRLGEDPATLWQVPEFYRKVDAAAIQRAAKTYLDSANRIQVTLMPESK